MARNTEDDPRYRRVRSKLNKAILELASKKPADEVSVSELTRVAGVSRTSFYGHADSPQQLLAEFLVGELTPQLDAILEDVDADGPSPAMWYRYYRTILDHVLSYKEVYMIVARSNSAAFGPLNGLFEKHARNWVETMAPRVVGTTITPLWKDVASHVLVQYLVGILVAWMQRGAKESPDEVIDTVLTMAPAWHLASADEEGHIRLNVNDATWTD